MVDDRSYKKFRCVFLLDVDAAASDEDGDIYKVGKDSVLSIRNADSF